MIRDCVCAGVLVLWAGCAAMPDEPLPAAPLAQALPRDEEAIRSEIKNEQEWLELFKGEHEQRVFTGACDSVGPDGSRIAGDPVKGIELPVGDGRYLVCAFPPPRRYLSTFFEHLENLCARVAPVAREIVVLSGLQWEYVPLLSPTGSADMIGIKVTTVSGARATVKPAKTFFAFPTYPFYMDITLRVEELRPLPTLTQSCEEVFDEREPLRP